MPNSRRVVSWNTGTGHGGAGTEEAVALTKPATTPACRRAAGALAAPAAPAAPATSNTVALHSCSIACAAATAVAVAVSSLLGVALWECAFVREGGPVSDDTAALAA